MLKFDINIFYFYVIKIFTIIIHYFTSTYKSSLCTYFSTREKNNLYNIAVLFKSLNMCTCTNIFLSCLKFTLQISILHCKIQIKRDCNSTILKILCYKLWKKQFLKLSNNNSSHKFYKTSQKLS